MMVTNTHLAAVAESAETLYTGGDVLWWLAVGGIAWWILWNAGADWWRALREERAEREKVLVHGEPTKGHTYGKAALKAIGALEAALSSPDSVEIWDGEKWVPLQEGNQCGK